jgi:hypothetical protein
MLKRRVKGSQHALTTNELVFLVIGLALGAATFGLVDALRRRVQHTVALRRRRIRHEENLAEKRARHLRTRLEQATGKNGWELDVETVYTALFSENGFDDQATESLLHPREEKAESEC